MTRFQLQALGVAVWTEEEETGLLSPAFCSVGSGKKRKQNEAAMQTETPPAKKIKPQTPNTFPKRKKVSCLVFLSGTSPYFFIYLFIFKDFGYLLIFREREREGEREGGETLMRKGNNSRLPLARPELGSWPTARRIL